MFYFKQKLLFGLAYILSWIPLSSSHPLSQWLVNVIERRTEWLSPHLNVSRRNLGLAFPDLSQDQIQCLAKESVIAVAKNFITMPSIWFTSPQWLKKNINSVVGIELIEEELDRGNSVIVLFLHYGNWEAQCAHLCDHFPQRRLAVVAKNSKYFDLLQKMRTYQRDVSIIPADNQGVRHLLKTLKKNGLVAFSPDQVPEVRKAGEYAPLFGIHTLTMTLLFQLLRRTKSKVFIGVAEQLARGFKVRYLKLDEAVYSDDKQQSLVALNRSIEAVVVDNPCEYLWAYKRYKNSQPLAVSYD